MEMRNFPTIPRFRDDEHPAGKNIGATWPQVERYDSNGWRGEIDAQVLGLKVLEWWSCDAPFFRIAADQSNAWCHVASKLCKSSILFPVGSNAGDGKKTTGLSAQHLRKAGQSRLLNALRKSPIRPRTSASWVGGWATREPTAAHRRHIRVRVFIYYPFAATFFFRFAHAAFIFADIILR